MRKSRITCERGGKLGADLYSLNDMISCEVFILITTYLCDRATLSPLILRFLKIRRRSACEALYRFHTPSGLTQRSLSVNGKTANVNPTGEVSMTRVLLV